MFSGTIARSYRPGQVIDIEIQLVANHLGFFTFALCPHNDMFTAPNRECFDRYLAPVPLWPSVLSSFEIMLHFLYY